jgi:signal peptidase I
MVNLKTLPKKRTVAFVILVTVLAVSGGALLFGRLFLFRPIRVPTGAMKNTIVPGDHLLAVRMFGNPERGNIIIFQFPPGTSERDREGPAEYIFRVVGLPGETIQLRGNTVYINDQPLDEVKVSASEDEDLGPLTVSSTEGTGPYEVFHVRAPDEPREETPFATTTPFRIPADNYFVLGDHRDSSEDSRYRGPVPKDLIWGSASYIYLSVSMDSGEVRTERTLKRVK